MSPRFFDRIFRRTATVHMSPDTPMGDTLLAYIGADAWRAAREHCGDDLASLKNLLQHYMYAWNIELLDRLGVEPPPMAEEFIAEDPEWARRAIARKRHLFGNDLRLFIDAKVLRGADGDLEVHGMATYLTVEPDVPAQMHLMETARTVAPRIARGRSASRKKRKQQKDARRKQRGR